MICGSSSASSSSSSSSSSPCPPAPLPELSGWPSLLKRSRKREKTPGSGDSGTAAQTLAMKAFSRHRYRGGRRAARNARALAGSNWLVD